MKHLMEQAKKIVEINRCITLNPVEEIQQVKKLTHKKVKLMDFFDEEVSFFIAFYDLHGVETIHNLTVEEVDIYSREYIDTKYNTSHTIRIYVYYRDLVFIEFNL